MHIAQILEDISKNSLNSTDKGDDFENLIRRWLLADPRYRGEIADVWRWEDFPAKDQLGSRDLGIDLVARTNEGEYWAIQCKFYGENTCIDKAAVDSFIAHSSRTFHDPLTGVQREFAARLWISTNDYFNKNAEEMTRNQRIPFQHIDLATLASANVDWEALCKGNKQNLPPKIPMPHQAEAVEKAHAHFARHDRGKLIMACGTGKTFTANLIARKEVQGTGTILCLVPSISLVGQFLNSWMSDTDSLTRAICICSDAKASRMNDGFEGSITELPLPATTSSEELARRYLHYARQLQGQDRGHIVIFSTYQSLDAVAEAQKKIGEELGEEHSFDLIICDEAHRTTGIEKPQDGSSPFTKIHEKDFIRGKKRLYMTATPRIYGDSVKTKARENDVLLFSMDDESLYGGEIHNVGFGYAVEHKLLTDYKVLVLTVGSEYQFPAELRHELENPERRELNFDVGSKLVGCINGLAKNTTNPDNALVWDADPRIMRRAIAFCPNINKKNDPASSMNTRDILPEICRTLFSSPDAPEHKIFIDARHIDGSMNSAERARHLAWLGDENLGEDECRVLCNVRCLSEGIDVPALDAAIFLSPRNSQIDVVQSVGRIMRNFRRDQDGGKKYGYIIIPVVVNPTIPPEEALDRNEAFGVVWSILNALRSHDDRFDAMINSLAFNREKPDKIVIDRTKFYGSGEDGEEGREVELLLPGAEKFFDKLEKQILGKMVEKVGSRIYWERWARNIAPLVQNLIGRISELVSMPGELQDSFHHFVKALQESINTSIDERRAIEMLGQHMVTRPVFEALFADYAFDDNNAVTRAMNVMVKKLLACGLEKDTALLDKFYDSVRRNLGEIKTLEGRQTIIKRLYDSFFKGAFPLAVEQLGIVYTPIECVDFILRSVDAALRREFNIGLTDRGVHILDPFTGTGTFITRLLQSGLIRHEDLKRKYLHEIHCNEIMLLAYYVADVNIESVFHEVYDSKKYLRFDGICLTDTFTLMDLARDLSLFPLLKDNFESLEAEAKAPIRVIIGNPPYSAGQKSANDNAQNLKYPALDRRIEETYVANESGVNKKNLYDSYIRAFRWASDRLRKCHEGGVIGFITNGGWLDGNAAAGFRKCLAREFSSIYVFQLRGDARTQGELRRKEGGNVFDVGSRAPVVITILIYNPAHEGEADIFYSDIGDYLTREQKLKIISGRSSIYDKNMQWQKIEPNQHGDWLNKRSDLFGEYVILGDKKDKNNRKTFFGPVYTLGLATYRDAWCYNYSAIRLIENISSSIKNYNDICVQISSGHQIDMNPAYFSWTRATKRQAQNNVHFSIENGKIILAAYRPFCSSNLYRSRQLNEMPGLTYKLQPTPESENRVICVESPGGKKDFSCLMVNQIADLHLLEAAQCFPLYYYEKKEIQQGSLLNDKTEYERRDGVTDWILSHVRGRFGNSQFITKERIFYYVYGILHSPDYRAKFNDDLKKSLPRIPIVERAEDFIKFAEAGQRLADLHLNYENVARCPNVVVTGVEQGNFWVEKMKFAGKQGSEDRSRIIYNADIEISNIPLRAHDYVVNGRSAIGWIMEAYRVKVDRDSGIRNDPNAWAEEHGKPRYILDLLLSIINLSLKTLDIVDGLPKLALGSGE